MYKLAGKMIFAVSLALTGSAIGRAEGQKPTIVLVHGAFAESSSWSGVIEKLDRDGYRVIAAANPPLRGVAADAAVVAGILESISGPVILVGHSYGGPVITQAAEGHTAVKALVYVAAFAPEIGESSLDLSSRFPGSTLGSALTSISRADGSHDLYIDPAKFHEQFAADVSAAQASVMAATQRPVLDEALAEPAGVASWRTIPSYAIYGSADRNIPPAVMKFMADRAHSVKTVVIEGASHAVMVSHPAEVASIIKKAASTTKWSHSIQELNLRTAD